MGADGPHDRKSFCIKSMIPDMTEAKSCGQGAS
eukprot:CAMPEP_0113239038 /NCGR_PEP_ID=MMETSP0008_2-20120614/5486_1 /TAXON_ID=97485 /ORGANISM="Prymnesium parvum" /LENGTH=32 /DNA_ID=CAMNT_0000086225 /DNA_START=523 /DNA_END=621 /DNA_ORIENTATION=+ /assembly_acc=CAM_ASM_000153